MIPPEKSAAVFRGVGEAFGTTAIDDVRRMTGGLSSDLVFRIVVDGSPYLLRIMTRIDERMDPVRIFACMRAASGAGLTPRVRYANPEDGVSITDFVEGVPLSMTEGLVRVPGTLRRLHVLPLFPKTFNYVTAHNGFIWRFRTANLLPNGEVEEAFTRYGQVCSVYPRLDADTVSCHSDLKPENILFDGQRVWLIDWRAAFANDRYFDLAVIANFVVTDRADEITFLTEYFGKPPDEYQLSRFFLMRQVLHMFAATVFLLLGSAGKPVDQIETPPSFRDFHRRIWAGEVDLADDHMKIVYGRVHWQQLFENIRDARFDEALRIVSDRHCDEKDIRRLLPAAP